MAKPDENVMRHSMAHIMAGAIQKLWPDVKFGVGPAIENGFYYDIDLGKDNLSEKDFPKIEKIMKQIINAHEKFEKIEMDIDDAIKWAKDNKQTYKLDLLNDLKRSGTTSAKDLNKEELGTITDKVSKLDKVTFYKNGNFIDLCRGPQINNTAEAGKFKLIRVSGAYWRGDSNKAQMQRIYGVAFYDQKDLDNYLDNLEEAKKRDHRKIGQELDLFVFSPLVGSGLPLFTPKGTIIREELNNYSQKLRLDLGFEKIWVPHIAKQELYEKSGHWAKFGDEWLSVVSNETRDKLVMKPMNCPHHIQIYASNPRSYKELPIKYLETTTVYRDEKAGELLGLARVRSITQDDSHIFCTPDQIIDVLIMLIDIVNKFYATMDLKLKVRLSFRDSSDGYLGSKELWQSAQAALEEAVKKADLKYFIAEGEAAFYGPKIDFLAVDALGRELQLATPQLDFVQPERFGITYTDTDGKEKTPVMVHFALLGAIERFMAAYLEHTAGKLPLWLSPIQLSIISVNQEPETLKYSEEISTLAKKYSIRAIVDNNNESVGKKIRKTEVNKIPYVVVIGDKEISSNHLTPRVRADLIKTDKIKPIKPEEMFKVMTKEVNKRLNHSTLQ